MKKQYQCNVDSTDKLTIEMSQSTQSTRRNVNVAIFEKNSSSYIALSPEDALDLAKLIKKELKGKSGQSKADLRAEILELKQLNAALASTQLDAVNLLQLEIEKLNERIENEIYNCYAS
jgi:predicted metal-binding protein